MLKRRYVQIFFLLALCAMILLDWQFKLPFYSYILLILAYASITFYGSNYIQANYFIHSYCHGSTHKKAVAITFDDGPNASTAAVLDILKEYHVPSAFFIIGKNIAGNELLLKRINEEGHIIGNHSYSHNFWFSMKGAGDMLNDIKQCDKEIEKVIGKKPQFFRPPYGVTNPMVANAITKGNYKSIGWSLRSYDTVANDKEQLLEKVLNKIKNGDIILFHDSGKHTIEILSDLIREIWKKGFEIVRTDALLGIEAYR